VRSSSEGTMAILIDEELTASPAEVGLPSGPIELTQTLHSDLGGEPAKITYSLSLSHNISFQTAGGPAKQVQLNVDVPGTETSRTDTVQLVETGGGTGIAEVRIKQLIEASNKANDSVILAIES
jgi:hypothetical protein